VITAVVEVSEESKDIDTLIACPGCDLLHDRQHLETGEFARCRRCIHVVQTCKPLSIDRTLAAVLAGIVLLLISLFLPFLSLSRSGIESTMSVIDAVQSLWASQMRWLGILTFGLIVLLPLARLLLLGWVLWRIRFNRKVRRSMRIAFRWAHQLEPWAMADIFMVGVVVSLVKVSSLAKVEAGLAFWSLLALVGVSVLINLTLCKDTVWSKLSQKS
jgi:paraquat-inducible protein A